VLFSIFVLTVVGLLLAVIVRAFWRARDPNQLTQRDIGVVVDRALRAYRRRFVPLLALAALLAPLGVASPLVAPLALQLIWPMQQVFAADISLTPWLVVARMGWCISALSLGRSLLMYSAACAVVESSGDQSPRSLWAALRQDWRRALQVVSLMSLPSLLITLVVAIVSETLVDISGRSVGLAVLSIVLGVPALLGMAIIILVRWSLVPAIMRCEALGPLAAIKRSGRLVRSQGSGGSNTTMALFAIGWLIVSTPAAGALLLLRLAVALTPETTTGLVILVWTIGSVFVAPLLALGATEFYLYVRPVIQE
jgi:hypothetical protein